MIYKSNDGKIRILSLSYGKDSMACIGAIEQLGWPIDGIVTAEVWATQDIPADLPPMVEFKAKADVIIKERWGFEVNHCCAMRGGKKLTYEDIFYRQIKKARPYGFPISVGGGNWCTALKTNGLRDGQREQASIARANSSEQELRIPQIKGNWCNSYLKQPVFRQPPTARR